MNVSIIGTGYVGLVTGACLAGPEDVIAEARLWRKRHGGTLFAMWPYAASALTGLRKRLPLMPRYYRHAVAIARELRKVKGVQVLPDPPQTNMMRLLLRTDRKRLDATIIIGIVDEEEQMLMLSRARRLTVFQVAGEERR